MSATEPFKRAEVLDTPGIVGARWWHEGLAHSDPFGRRTALKALLIGGGVLAAGAVLVKACSSEDTKTEQRTALDAQKEFGWDFGARNESLTFDGATTVPYNPAMLGTLASVLTPTRSVLRPYFIPTLFQSSDAVPTINVPDDRSSGGTFLPVSAVLHPIFTMAMDVAFRRGKALAALFKGKTVDAAVVVDLPGPEAVAFAAGAAEIFEPVFAIDNWPHPRGVVPAHLTLAAAAYYQPLFAKAGALRPSTPLPLFVLDRSRLSTYVDNNTRFDNRHLARLPSAAQLTQLGIRRILYVAPDVSDVPELDDLNEDFVHDQAASIVVKIVGAAAFGPTNADPSHALRSFVPNSVTTSSVPLPGPAPDLPYFYALSPQSNELFWQDYPWLAPAPAVPPAQPGTFSGAGSVVPAAGRDYVPRPRATPFSAPSGMVSLRLRPPGFGMVPVLIGITTGAVIGAAAARSGSWNRSSGSSWGGGGWGGG